MKVAILGYGDRGALYAGLFQRYGVEISAVCDTDKQKLVRAQEAEKIPDSRCFNSEEAFWAQGRTADLLVISTLDKLHHAQACRAIEMGYDVLLEKPIACTIDECREIEALAKKHGTKIYLCYVLRYAPFFMKIKEIIESGVLGKLITVNHTEGVGYWHQAHSFVRGNWRKKEETTPMIVAKCCHDMDILYWLVDANPVSVSSMGSLSFFNEENAPTGSASHCCDCSIREKCPYDNFKFYRKNPWWIWKTGYYNGAYEDEKAIHECLSDKSNPYSRCVFRCDNDVVDHQVTNILFENGVTAHLTMTAFTADTYRKIHIHGTYGELYGNVEENKLYCCIYNKEKTLVEMESVEGLEGHGGGDSRMVKEIVDAYRNGLTVEKNGIEGAMRSHYLCFASEESRLKGGQKVDL